MVQEERAHNPCFSICVSVSDREDSSSVRVQDPICMIHKQLEM